MIWVQNNLESRLVIERTMSDYKMNKTIAFLKTNSMCIKKGKIQSYKSDWKKTGGYLYELELGNIFLNEIKNGK